MEAITTMEERRITVDLLHDLWPTVREEVKRLEPRLGAVLCQVSPAAVHESRILLTTPYRFHAEKMSEEAHRVLIENVISRLVKRRVVIRTDQKPLIDDGTPPGRHDLATMPYTDYLKTEHWQKTANAAKERAGKRCQICNKYGQLHTHHRTYERRGKELPEDLIVLCAPCHKLFHENGKLARRK